MMSVKDYARDIRRSIKDVLDKCRELNIKTNNENDILTEENIIDLDNNITPNTSSST